MKVIRKIITSTFVLCSILQISAQDSTRYLTLSQACQLGANNNINVVNASLETQKTRYQVKETQSTFYPQLEGYSDLNYYYAIPKMLFPGEFFGASGEIPVEIGTKYDWSSGFKASLILFNRSYYTATALAKRMQHLSELSLEQKKEEVVYQVSQVYFLCQSTSTQISYLGKNMLNTDRLLDILKKQSENGVARKIDYSKVLVTKNNLQTQLDKLVQLYEQQIALLKFLTGMDFKIKVELTDSLSFSQMAQISELSDFNGRTAIKILDKQMEVASFNKNASLQSYLPSLSASGQLFYQGQQNDFNYFKGSDKFFKVGFVGLNLSVPIFDGFEKHAKAQQYKIELLQLENTRKNTSDNFQKDYTDASGQYNNNLKAALRQQENIAIAEEDYNITLQNYRQQVVPLSDLMLSGNSLTEARLSYVDALLQLKNAELEVKKLKGDLLKF